MPRELLEGQDLSLYRQVETILREQIADGELRPGDRLLSEPALSATYSVSRDTVRQALDALARDGLIERQVGRGTFVRAHPARAVAAPARPTHDWRSVVALADTAPRLVRTSAIAAPPHVARALGVAADEPVPFLIRMHDGEPKWGVKRYVHPRLGTDMATIGGAQDFRSALAKAADGPVSVTRFWVEAIHAEPRFAMLLDCTPGAPLMSIWWLEAASGEPVACTQMLQLGSSFALAIEP